jgi:hypothetical protein
MKKANCWIAAIGVMLLPCASFAQTPAIPPTAEPAAVAAIPADQQATKEQLTKLFEVMRLRKQMEQMTTMMSSLVQQQMQGQMEQMQKDHPEMASMTDEQKQAASQVMGKFMEKTMNLYASDELIADISTVYQKHLTRSDIDGIIAFYGSPAGQDFIDKTPVITREYMELVMSHMQEKMKPLIEEMTKEMETITKPSSPVLRVAPPPPPPPPPTDKK